MRTIRIQVRDAASQKPLQDVVVVITGKAVDGEVTAVTADAGACMADLPDAAEAIHVRLEREGYSVTEVDLDDGEHLAVLHIQPATAPPDVVLPAPSTRETLGEIAFAAYDRSRGGVNHLGQPTPRWPDLPSEIREAWCAAAQAVVDASAVVRGAP